MSRFRNTPQAEADLEAITDYYAANNPDAGIRLLDAITARCRQLASQPHRFEHGSEQQPGHTTEGYGLSVVAIDQNGYQDGSD